MGRLNDAISVDEIGTLEPSAIVISPGPCAPAQAGITVEAIRRWGSSIPMLGVCLGHQAIGEAYGGRVIRADRVMFTAALGARVRSRAHINGAICAAISLANLLDRLFRATDEQTKSS